MTWSQWRTQGEYATLFARGPPNVHSCALYEYALLNVLERFLLFSNLSYSAVILGRHCSMLAENDDKRKPSREYVIPCIDSRAQGRRIHKRILERLHREREASVEFGTLRKLGPHVGELCQLFACPAISSSYPSLEAFKSLVALFLSSIKLPN